MKTIQFPLEQSMLKTLRKRKCFARRKGPYLYHVETQELKLYEVKLSPTTNGFTYTCIDLNSGKECKSMGYPVICRHSVSAALLAIARNEGLKRAA